MNADFYASKGFTRLTILYRAKKSDPKRQGTDKKINKFWKSGKKFISRPLSDIDRFQWLLILMMNNNILNENERRKKN